ncbi:hypothetical protein [Bacillus rhizoplanae]|uniref:hypothetical protein n=1 Tax=Bacillus rhizoplanae TaxID=2880966 RepID=UPI003D21CA75
MKKIIITTLAIVSVMGLATNTFANTGTKTEVSKEELTYLKSINPSITNSEADSLMKQRKQIDELHKQLEQVRLDYGILVDNTKDPNKEPKNLDDLTAKQRENYLQLSKKMWDAEIQFLDAQYKAGLIKEDVYKADKKNFEDLRQKNSLNNR